MFDQAISLVRSASGPSIVAARDARVGSNFSELAAWLQSRWPEIAIAVAVAAALYALMNLVRGWGLRLCRGGKGSTRWYGILGRALSRTGQVFMVLSAAQLVAAYSAVPPILAVTLRTLFTISSVYQAAIWVRELVIGALENRVKADENNAQSLGSALGIIRVLISILLFAIATIMVLGNLGVNVTGLIAGLGIGGIAIGLAAQGIFADLFAALAILFDRAFRVGDSISYDKGSSSGTVEHIGLKSTRIRGGGGEERIIANTRLLGFEILNTTHRVHNRHKFEFFLVYSTPPELIRRLPEILRDAVQSEGYTLIHGGLNGFALNGLSYDVEFESIDADFPANARDHVAAAVLARLSEHGISFAYPTQVSLMPEKTKATPTAGSGPADSARRGTLGKRGRATG